MRIAVLGLWHLGEVYSACLSELGHTVLGISEDMDVVGNLRNGIPPLEEPGLTTLLKRNLKNGRLRFSDDFSLLGTYDVLWVAFDVPVNTKDEAQTSIVFSSIKKSLQFLKANGMVVVSSQLPVGTSEKIQAILKKRSSRILYAYVPENLRLGEGVVSFMKPGRVVIGSHSNEAFRKIKLILRRVPAEFLFMNPASAEMVKHALNSFLATSLSFMYDIADVCEKVGADVLSVSRALKADPRIGAGAYVDASIGFSGGTLGRDLRFLEQEGKRFHITLPIISAAYQKNAGRYGFVLEKLRDLGKLKGKRVAILGLTYKAGTPTLRRSLALEIAGKLASRGVSLSFFDPALSMSDVSKSYKGAFVYGKNVYDALLGAHAAILMMPWKGVENLNWKEVGRIMRPPKVFLDSRNFFSKKVDVIRKQGLDYKGVGR